MDKHDMIQLLGQTYAAFNLRDIDGAFAAMKNDVSWPRASEGGSVVGKAEVRAYWTRQWSEFDPHVEALEVIVNAAGGADVRVHQLVRSLQGEVLSDSLVWHSYTFADGLIQSMVVRDDSGVVQSGVSAAFAHH